MSDFAERLDAVRRRVREACVRVNRNSGDVSILAVAKMFGPERVREAAESGLTVIGESRIQEAKQKIPLCPGHLEWHMIGHLQRNKVSEAVQLFRMIHSVDSWRLLQAINSACKAIGSVMPVCIEVNVSGESSKFGLAPDDVPGVLEQSSSLMNIDIVGLMTIPPFTKDTEDARPFFRNLRELRDEWQDRCDICLRELSMGMSNDFGVAVEEGATWIRLGSVLFGERHQEEKAHLE